MTSKKAKTAQILLLGFVDGFLSQSSLSKRTGWYYLSNKKTGKVFPLNATSHLQKLIGFLTLSRKIKRTLGGENLKQSFSFPKFAKFFFFLKNYNPFTFCKTWCMLSVRSLTVLGSAFLVAQWMLSCHRFSLVAFSPKVVDNCFFHIFPTQALSISFYVWGLIQLIDLEKRIFLNKSNVMISSLISELKPKNSHDIYLFPNLHFIADSITVL